MLIAPNYPSRGSYVVSIPFHRSHPDIQAPFSRRINDDIADAHHHDHSRQNFFSNVYDLIHDDLWSFQESGKPYLPHASYKRHQARPNTPLPLRPRSYYQRT